LVPFIEFLRNGVVFEDVEIQVNRTELQSAVAAAVQNRRFQHRRFGAYRIYARTEAQFHPV
jgi:hypothetical protein